MHRYYWAAKAVTQLNQILMLNIEERISGSGGAPMRPITARFFDRGGMLEVAHDALYLNNPHAILETFLVFQQTPGLQGLSARTLRALYNSRQVMGREVPPRPHQPRAIHGHPATAQDADARAAADEPDQRARPLPVGVPPHRRAHAARPLPRLHRGPAHRDGGAQRATLLHPRACARIPLLQPAGGAVGPALAAVRGRPLPRHRQGPRRRPFRAGSDGGPALLPRPRHRARGHPAHRVPRAAPPDDEPHRAEGGPVGCRRDPGLCPDRGPPPGA